MEKYENFEAFNIFITGLRQTHGVLQISTKSEKYYIDYYIDKDYDQYAIKLYDTNFNSLFSYWLHGTSKNEFNCVLQYVENFIVDIITDMCDVSPDMFNFMLSSKL